MIAPFTNLRRYLGRLRRKYIHRSVTSKPFLAGLPDGINFATVDEVIKEHFGAGISSISHQHLSGWKESGAFRLRIQTAQNGEIYLIYKNANYSRDQIPALTNLSIHPGPPEYAILRQRSNGFARFLPKVYLAEEVTPNKQYRYLLEDLGQNYQRTFGPENVLEISSLLPGFHQALCEWAPGIVKEGLINYGVAFSRSLQSYAYQNLESFSKVIDDSTLRQVIKNWDEITSTHLDPEFFSNQLITLIHGDTNYTNIHMHKNDPRQFKVVDWEWAGFGYALSDLTSLLKGSPEKVEEAGLRRYIEAAMTEKAAFLNPNLSFQEYQRHYYWCKLERGLLDASFLASQQMNNEHQANFNLTRAVTQSLSRALAAYQILSGR